MERLFTTAMAEARGISMSALKWGVKAGKFTRIHRGVYLDGSSPPTVLERALALVLVTGGVASGSLAATLHQLDSVVLRPPFVTVLARVGADRPAVRRGRLPVDSIVEVANVRCTDGMQTLIDCAARVGDLVWEQMLESALRKRLLSVDDLQRCLPELGRSRTPGTRRIRRVLDLRPVDAPPTESLLETFMVQLIRSEPRLPQPSRQVVVNDRYDQFVARVDLAWPRHGIFIELDGEHHKYQPVYDARRETAVVAATGWLPGRFSWTEVTRAPRQTARRLTDLFAARLISFQHGLET